MASGASRFIAVLAVAVASLPAVAQLTPMQEGPQYFDGTSSMGPYAWVSPSQAGSRPRVMAGTYPVCRAWMPTQSVWHPGKIHENKCKFAWGTEEKMFSDGIQLLVYTGTAAEAYLYPQNWVQPASGAVPFLGGTETPTMYVCRGSYQNEVHPGKVWSNQCHIGYGGKAVVLTSYQVLSLYNGAKVASAITQQINQVVAGDKIQTTLELVTVQQFPGSFNLNNLVRPSAGYSILSATTNNSACPNTPGSECRQRHKWVIDPGTNCTLNGSYRAEFTKKCVTGACGAGAHGISFSLQSENFCSSTTVSGR